MKAKDTNPNFVNYFLLSFFLVSFPFPSESEEYSNLRSKLPTPHPFIPPQSSSSPISSPPLNFFLPIGEPLIFFPLLEDLKDQFVAQS
ncbi:hypothetical protein K1719_035443 [Acacia pycnantha]|nr:hypothetical protein K1719_035443 [Acacia pycnantha]